MGNSWGSLQEEGQSVEVRLSDPMKPERYNFNIPNFIHSSVQSLLT